MKPDYERATAKAEELLRLNGTACPMTILKRLPGVLVSSYSETSDCTGIDRQKLLTMFGEHNQDAFTVAKVENGKTKYLVVYNKQLTCEETRSALSRELGHIILGHDGTRPEDVRNEEALCFAYHLMNNGGEQNEYL